MLELQSRDVANIDVITLAFEGDIFLEGILYAELQPTEIGDRDGDEIPDLMVKFDRSEVQSLVSVGEVELVITGKWRVVLFKGSDIIRVIEPSREQRGNRPEVPPGQSGEHSSNNPEQPPCQNDQGKGPPSAPPGQDGQPPGQSNQGNQGQGNQGGNGGSGQGQGNGNQGKGKG